MGQKGGHALHAYIWAPIGPRPPIVRDNRHVATHIFGVFCPHRAVGAAMIMPYANTEAMNVHLKVKSRQARIRRRLASAGQETSTWRFLINDPDRIRSIGARDWARVNL